VSKAIYLRLPYPARNGGLEQAFVEACDRDASVDAFCKVSEQKHTFARLRYTQEGLNVCNGNQIEDSRACENVSCPVFETCARVPLRPERPLSDAHTMARTTPPSTLNAAPVVALAAGVQR
jgi:hypothetical protein